jgi:undecaprenyl pyrophosphate phosphatase UppP
MKLSKIIDRTTDFGTLRSRNDLLSFTLKILVYIIPAVIIGHFIDIAVKKYRNNNVFGKNIIYYILLQTIFNIAILYLFILFLPRFMSEFQTTVSGGYFIALYFSMQTNYIDMLKGYMNSLI